MARASSTAMWPENIFTVSGRAVLADFGIAHIADEGDTGHANLTSDGMVLGTVAYMSPEQAQVPADRRAI
jgi:serine/threonine protein kinase